MLNLKGMLRNHHLARALADVGIGMLFRMLEYKFERRGKNLLRADRWYPSSKRCPVCGKVNAGDFYIFDLTQGSLRLLEG